MADNPTPDEELSPRERFERLVKGPEPHVFQSVKPEASDSENPEELADSESKVDSAEPQPFDRTQPDDSGPPEDVRVAQDDGRSVLERFEALKQRLEDLPLAPPPGSTNPPTGSEASAPSAASRRSAESAAQVSAEGALGEDSPSVEENEQFGADLQEVRAPIADPPSPFGPEEDGQGLDDLDPLTKKEAKSKRRAARKAKRKAKRENRSFWKELPVLIVVSIVVAIVIKTFFFQAFYIPSASMVPSLEVNDRVLVNKLSYQFGAIERGDILVFDSPEAVEVDRSFLQRVVRRVGEATGLVSPDTVLIKRVIALPGETIEIRDSQIYINDSPIAEPYLAESVTTRDFDVMTVPADHVFMMGDNRNQSRDSRVFGPISKDEIVGRAFVRVWPASRWSGL